MAISLKDFYNDTATQVPEGMHKEIGHFNVFDSAEIASSFEPGAEPVMPYDRRSYYKISIIQSKSRAEYADKIIDIEKDSLLFATPKIPYHYFSVEEKRVGLFCIFTDEFLMQQKSGVVLDELPIFQSGGYPIFQVSEQESNEIVSIFKKMQKEISSSYVYKFDLIRNYVVELIHYGQKLQPASALHPKHSASARVSSLFIELLERQFPIQSTNQKLSLRTAKDYADRLSVHVNHLNKVLKENTGKTTTDIISGRVAQEAKILLKQTNWNVSEIAYALGFEQVAHFSNFFKKQTSLTPLSFRD